MGDFGNLIRCWAAGLMLPCLLASSVASAKESSCTTAEYGPLQCSDSSGESRCGGTDPSTGDVISVGYQHAVSLNAGCAFPLDSTAATTNVATSTAVTTNVATSPGTSSAVATFTSSVETNIETTSIKKVATSASGQQTSSLADAAEVATLGAAKAASIGVIFCAQGANANLTSPEDAAVFYANCQQNFDAAKGMSGKPGGFNPDQSILNGEAAQQSLQNLEKNFGITPSDYLSKMLGNGSGLGALAGLLDGKIPEGKLAEALEASSKLSPSDLARDPNKFAVELGQSMKKPGAGLREALRKKLSEKFENRETASIEKSKQANRNQQIGDKEHLEPLRADLAFGSNEEGRELTIFDIVHLRYAKLAARMHR